jgi:deoxyribonuclease V
MILAVDVAYAGDTARAAGVLFESWESSTFTRVLTTEMSPVAEYVPGQFYLRELPCILKLLEQIDESLECIVIDGYVTLGETQKPGLGMKLWESMKGGIPVIGVAKSEFRGTPESAKVYRGGSSRPLFVTAIGVPLDEAKARITRMSGQFQMPDLLRTVDRVARGT